VLSTCTMVYRHLEEEAGGNEEAKAASRTTAKEEALLQAETLQHFTTLPSCIQMVYRHLEEEAGGDEEAQAASHAAAEEEELLTASAPPLPCRLVSSFDGLHVAAVTSLAVAGDGSALFSGAGRSSA